MLRSLRRALAGSLARVIVLTSTMPASATDAPKARPRSVAVDLKHIGAELDLFAAQAHRTRLASTLTGLGVGSALIPSGIVLLGRTDGVSRALVIGMIIGGSAQVVSVPFTFIPTRMDEIRDAFMRRPANLDSEARVRGFENAWHLAAEASRRKRMYVGATLLSVGVSNLSGGLTLLLAPEGIFGMSRLTQYTWGGVLMGVGIPVTTLGMRFLLEWSPEEISWAAYHAMQLDAGYWERLHSPSIGVAPMPGGALGFTTMQF